MAIAGQGMIDERGGGCGFVDLPRWGMRLRAALAWWQRISITVGAVGVFDCGDCHGWKGAVGEERTAATAMDGRAWWGRRGLRISRSRGGVPHRTDTTARHGWKRAVGEATERRPPWMEWRGGGGTDCEGGD